MNQALEQIKTVVLTTLGHAVTAAAVGAVYAVEQKVASGQMDISIVGPAALLGAAIGFTKSVLDTLTSLQITTTPSVPPAGAPVVEDKKEEIKPKASSIKKYLGI